MRSLIPPALAGALCLPAAYSLSRDGDFSSAAVIVVVIGAIGGAIAMAMSHTPGNARFGHLAMAFVVGALASELVSFTHYYLTYGYRDQLLGVGVIMESMEFIGIAVVGGTATCLAALVQKRLAAWGR
jgi:O-antigen ligase